MFKKILLIVLSMLSIFIMFTSNAKSVTLKEKIGQMIIIGFKESELHANDVIVQDILNQRIGGVILFDYDFQTKKYERNIKSPQQLKMLTSTLQQYAKNAAHQSGNQFFPLFISIDYEGGKVNRLKDTYGFAKTLSPAELSTRTQTEVHAYAEQMAATLKNAGININFAPVVDVNVNPENPIIGKLGRSFSSDPAVVTQYASIFAHAYHEHGILCALKHFPGHGSSTGDSHLGFVDVTHTWKNYELQPYEKLFQDKNNCSIVMTAHIVHNGLDGEGYPASLSRKITNDLLRKKLKFNGLIVTDDLQMKAISDNYHLNRAIELAVNAGADLLIFGNQLPLVPQKASEVIDIIYNDVKQGKIAESRINDAYERIIAVKKHLIEH